MEEEMIGKSQEKKQKFFSLKKQAHLVENFHQIDGNGERNNRSC